jgi:hypothetical protein
MTTTMILPQTTIQEPNRPTACHAASGYLDLSRGAAEFGIRQTVWLDATVTEDFTELDSSLGRNVAGVVLSVLARLLTVQPDGLGEDVITACLLRREDAKPVEVDLQLNRSRYRGATLLALRKIAERETPAEG